MATVVPFNQIRTFDQIADYAAAGARAAGGRCPYVAAKYNTIMWEAMQATQGYGAPNNSAQFNDLKTKLGRANTECDQIAAAKGTASPINTEVERKPAPPKPPAPGPTPVKAGFPWLWGIVAVGALWYLTKGKKKRKGTKKNPHRLRYKGTFKMFSVREDLHTNWFYALYNKRGKKTGTYGPFWDRIQARFEAEDRGYRFAGTLYGRR